MSDNPARSTASTLSVSDLEPQEGAPEIKAIIFDYGNVMISWDPAGAISGRVPVDQWDTFVQEGGFHDLNLRSDAGDAFEDVVADLAATHPERPDWVQMLRTYRENFAHSIVGHVPGTLPIVRELLDQGRDLYLLSNFDAVTFRYARRLVPELERFAGVVVSGEERLVKPDARIYRRALERYGLDPATTLFIDDTPANVETARDLGMQVLLFTGSGRLRAQLNDLGLLAGPAQQAPITPLD